MNFICQRWTTECAANEASVYVSLSINNFYFCSFKFESQFPFDVLYDVSLTCTFHIYQVESLFLSFLSLQLLDTSSFIYQRPIDAATRRPEMSSSPHDNRFCPINVFTRTAIQAVFHSNSILKPGST